MLFRSGWFGQTGLRPAYLALAVITTLLVVWRHRANLQRLLNGSEPRLGEKRPSGDEIAAVANDVER